MVERAASISSLFRLAEQLAFTGRKIIAIGYATFAE